MHSFWLTFAPSTRGWLLGCALSIGLCACQNSAPRDTLQPEAPQRAQPPREPSEATKALAAPSAAPTVAPQPGSSPVLTQADADAIKVALLARLRQSVVEHRDYLITNTQAVPATVEGGFVRIGTWVMQPQGGRLMLTYRMPAGPMAAEAYRAEVVNVGGQWNVQEIVSGQIRRR